MVAALKNMLSDHDCEFLSFKKILLYSDGQLATQIFV